MIHSRSLRNPNRHSHLHSSLGEQLLEQQRGRCAGFTVTACRFLRSNLNKKNGGRDELQVAIGNIRFKRVSLLGVLVTNGEEEPATGWQWDRQTYKRTDNSNFPAIRTWNEEQRWKAHWRRTCNTLSQYPLPLDHHQWLPTNHTTKKQNHAFKGNKIRKS